MRRAMNFGIDPDSGAELGMNVFFEQNMSKLNAKDVFFSWYNKRKIYTHQDDPEMRSETSKFTLKVSNLCQCPFKILILLVYVLL